MQKIKRYRSKPIRQVGEWVTVDYAASLLGLTKWAIYQRIRRKTLHAETLGKTYLVRIGDLESYLPI